MKRIWLLTATFVLALLILTSTFMPFSEAKPEGLRVEWQRQLPGISGNSVVQTTDGGYLVLGTNASWAQVNDPGERMYVNQ